MPTSQVTQSPTPTKRENDSSELEHFKTSINLVAYATQQHGYQLTEESRRGDWSKLHKEGETLIVTRKPDGHDIYMNTGDERDSGSIIDFVKARGGGYGQALNIGQARQTLRSYLGEDGPARDTAALAALPRPAQPAERMPVPEGLNDLEKRNFLIGEALGIKPALTDRKYLHGRGLSDDTIDAPAFAGRVFTAHSGQHHNTAFPLYNEKGIASVEEKNDKFKSLLPVPKDGVWASHATDGRGTPVERIVVMESAIDAMAKYQLDKSAGEGKMPNTMYIATAGNPTERQTELIQRIIDKQDPKAVILGNDNDPAGRRFNINYLDQLQPARRESAVEGLPVYEQSAPAINFHATRDGNYNTALRIEFNHDKAHEGRTAVADLTKRIATLNGGEQHADQPPLTMAVLRSSSEQTVVRVGVSNGDMPALELLARELHHQREQRLPEAERQPQGFIRTEYAQSKDYARDLEMVAAGLSPAERQAQAQREQLEKQTQQQIKMETEAREQRRQQEEKDRQQREAEEARRKENDPEEIKRRQASDRALGNFMVSAAIADNGGAMPGRAEQPVTTAYFEPDIIRRDDNSRVLQLQLYGTGPEHQVKLHEARERLEKLGVSVGTVETTPEKTILAVAYRTDQPEYLNIARALATEEKGELALKEQHVARSERHTAVELDDKARYNELNPSGPLLVAGVTAGGQAGLIPNPAPEFERARSLREQQGLPTLEEARAQERQQYEGQLAALPASTQQARAVEQWLNRPAGAELPEANKVQPLQNDFLVADTRYPLALRVEETAPADGNRPRAEIMREQFQLAGAQTALLPVATEQPGVLVNELRLVYNPERANAAGIEAQINKATEQPGVTVTETAEGNNSRTLAAVFAEPLRAPSHHQALEKDLQATPDNPVRFVGVDMPRTAENRAFLEQTMVEAKNNGASVDFIKENGQHPMPERLNVVIGYRLDQPELDKIDKQLSALAGTKDAQLVLDQPEERKAELAKREAQGIGTANGPGQPTPPGLQERTAEPAQPNQVEREKLATHAELKVKELDVTPVVEVAPKAPEAEEQKVARDRQQEQHNGGNQMAIVKVVDKPEPGDSKESGKAERIHTALEVAGANAGEIKSTITPDGIRHSEMDVSYRTDQATIKEISNTLDKAGRSDGVQVLESSEHKSERQSAAQRADQTRDRAELSR